MDCKMSTPDQSLGLWWSKQMCHLSPSPAPVPTIFWQATLLRGEAGPGVSTPPQGQHGSGSHRSSLLQPDPGSLAWSRGYKDTNVHCALGTYSEGSGRPQEADGIRRATLATALSQKPPNSRGV